MLYHVDSAGLQRPAEQADRVDALDVVIAHRRKELDVRHARVDRAETQAAGLSVAIVAFAGLVAALLRDAHHHMSLVAIVVVGTGGACLLAALGFAFTSRDTQTEMSGWFKRIAPKRVLNSTRRVLGARGKYNDMETDIERPASLDPVIVRHEVADWLRNRLVVVREIAAWREKIIRIAALLFATGVVILLVGVVLATARA